MFFQEGPIWLSNRSQYLIEKIFHIEQISIFQEPLFSHEQIFIFQEALLVLQHINYFPGDPYASNR